VAHFRLRCRAFRLPIRFGSIRAEVMAMGLEDREHESRTQKLVRAIEHPEYERVCKKCGQHWDVPSGFVHGAAHASASGSVLNRRVTATELASFDSAERQYDTCPGCAEYKSFTEHRLHLESREQDVLENEE
jgi:hypothetical protein